MKTRYAGVCQALALTLAVFFCLSTLATAQEKSVYDEHARPMFVVIPPKPALPTTKPSSGTLTEWNGSFTYNNTQYNYVMVGADPSTNQGVIVTAWLVPIKLVLSNGDVFDPLSGGPF